MAVPVEDIVRLLVSCLTAGSIVFAVYQYRRSWLIEQVRQLRVSLGDVPRQIEKLSNLLDEGRFNQVGLRIVDELRQLFGSNISPDELANQIRDEDNHDLLVGAVYEGIDRSKPSGIIEEIEDKLGSVEFKLNGLFPVLSQIFSTSLFLVEKSVSFCYDSNRFNRLWKDEQVRERLCAKLENYGTTNLAYGNLANIMSSAPMAATRSGPLDVISAGSTISMTVVSKITSASDANVIKLSNQDRGVKLDLKKIEDENNPIKNLDYLLFSSKHLFSGTEWDAVLASLTILKEKSKISKTDA